MFKHKKIYYEFIEAYPTILKSKVPIIQILMGLIYYIILPFSFLFVLFKRGLSIFSRIDITKGSEQTMSNRLDLNTLKKIEVEPEKIIETKSIFYNNKESIEIKADLEKRDFDLSKITSSNFRIKKRIEIYISDFPEDDEEIITLTVPKIANNIYNIFKKLKLI